MAVPALFAAFSFFFYAPCALYFPNAEQFVFTFADIWWILLGCFLLSAGVFYGIGRMLKKGRSVWSALLFAFGLSVILQGSFLFEDLGTFNGLPYEWRNSLLQIIRDAAVWLLIAAVCVIAALRGKEKSGRIFSALSFLGLAFLAVTSGVLMLSSKNEYLQKGEFFVSDRDLFTVSQKENAIVLVLDMFDSSYMESVVARDPDLIAELDGFTWFSNTTSNFGSTGYTIGSLLSGSLMLNQQPSFSETLNANAASDRFFPMLLEEGWSLGIYTEGKFIPDSLALATDNCLNERAGIVDLPAFCRAIYRMAACRYLPDALRPLMWLRGTEFDGLYGVKNSPYRAYTIDTMPFYEKLQQGALKSVDQPCFRLIHLFGAHYPYTMDENFLPIQPSWSDENAVGAAKASLKVAIRFLEEMKALGVFNGSLILIMGDHGYSVDGALTNPLLLIKRPGETHAFETSCVPACFSDLRVTMLTALSLPAENISGEDIYSLTEGQAHERLYYQMYDGASNGQSRLVEYSVAPEGNARKNFSLTDREISPTGEISKHSETCEYCLANGTDPVDAPNSASILHERTKTK